ncbi:MAG: 3'-5' exonuclease [Bacteroidales bacterium]
MLSEISLDQVLFLDIETVPAYSAWSVVPESLQKLWEKKSASFRKENESGMDVYQRAGIYAEFGKIICISAGFLNRKNNERCLRLKSFAGDSEGELLEEFKRMMIKFCRDRKAFLCAHNGKEFDFPYIARRMLIHQIPLPEILDVAGKKPWEVNFLDTMELWRFGDYKNYTSLELLTTVFGIPTPKDDLDGSMVASAYWEKHELERITTYCEKDVIAIAQLMLRYRNEPLLADKEIEHVS